MGIVVVILMCVVMAIVLSVLRIVNRLVVGTWLNASSEKWGVLADCLDAWLFKSWRLPGRMKAHGIRHWQAGWLLVIFSPVCLFALSAVPWIYRTYVPYALSEKDAPYSTHSDIVALTGLTDLPAFHFTQGDAGTLYSKERTFYFTFDKPLSDQCIKKLKAMCADADNVLWTDAGDTVFTMCRAWDGHYIKSPMGKTGGNHLHDASDWTKFERVMLTIDKRGFVLKPDSIWADLTHYDNRDSISKNTGVNFPEYKFVNVTQDGDVIMQLAAKPSDDLIREMKASSKWENEDDSTYIYKEQESLNYYYLRVVKGSRLAKMERIYIGW